MTVAAGWSTGAAAESFLQNEPQALTATEQLLFNQSYFLPSANVVYSTGWSLLSRTPLDVRSIRLYQVGGPSCHLTVVGQVLVSHVLGGPVANAVFDASTSSYLIAGGGLSEIRVDFMQTGAGAVNCGVAIYGINVGSTEPGPTDTYAAIHNLTNDGAAQITAIQTMIMTRPAYEAALPLLADLDAALDTLGQDALDGVTPTRIRHSFEAVENSYLALKRTFIVDPDDHELLTAWFQLKTTYQSLRAKF